MLAGYNKKTGQVTVHYFLPMMNHIICNAFPKNIHVGQKSDFRQSHSPICFLSEDGPEELLLAIL